MRRACGFVRARAARRNEVACVTYWTEAGPGRVDGYGIAGLLTTGLTAAPAALLEGGRLVVAKPAVCAPCGGAASRDRM